MSQIFSMEGYAGDYVKNTTFSEATYIAALIELSPLIIVAFVIMVLRGLLYIKQTYLHRGVLEIFLNVVFSSIVMAFFSVGVVLCLSIINVNLSEEERLGVVVLLSSGGMKVLDALIRHKSGYHIFEVSQEEEFLMLPGHETKEQSSEEQGDKHVTKTTSGI